ncbi:MAG: hypothetical protein MI806_31520 [Minwuiales bacterium]|nr:hypothetical protein [Minwuiales bacterium]
MNKDVPEEVHTQLQSLDLETGRPLIVSDADEVLFAFMASFETYLNNQQLSFDWSSFALTGNIRRESDNEPIDGQLVRDHLRRFFADHTEEMAPVPGAAEALDRLSARAQIVVLSNVPLPQLEARRRALAKHGMDYPLIANIGAKGGAVQRLAEQADAPTVFIDDIPHNHTSVRQSAAHVWRLHFVADPRLAALLGPAADSHHRTDNWSEALSAIETYLDRHGS